MKKLYITLGLLVGCVALMAQNTRHYYSCDFENAQDRARWKLTPTVDKSIDDQIVNRWYFGAPGNNGIGGKYGIYISDDLGATAHYTDKNCFVIAYDTITLDPLSSGDYQLSFEYRAVGNVYSNFDGLYVFWLPVVDPDSGDTIQIYSNSTSSNSLPKELKEYVVTLQPTADIKYAPATMTWKQYSATLKNKRVDGTPHYLVFAWTNGSMMPQQPPACVDNIEISDKRPCDPPKNLTVTINGGKCEMTWSGEAEKYEVSAYSYEEDRWYGPVEVLGHSYAFVGLPPSETDFVVRSKCADDLYSLKVIQNMLVYNPDELCVDYLDLNTAKCYTGTGFKNTVTFNSYVLGKPVDYGPTAPESRHTVHFDKTEVEPRSGGELKTIPDGELASVRLGNWLNGNETERIEYSFMVDTLNYPVLLLKYAPLLEAPSHKFYENPRFVMDIMIGGVTIGSCGQADFNANNVLIGTESNHELRPEAAAQGWHITPKNIAQANGADVIWKEWTTVGVNLKDTAYAGKELTVRLSTYDCAMVQHCGYAYFTLGCSDGKLKDMQCGQVNPVFNAPDGFVYRWYLASDENKRLPDGMIPEQYVKGHEQAFEAGYHDDNLYAVDCMFVQDSACYFTLYASTLATNPIPVISAKRTAVDCENRTYTYHLDASKSYVQEIDHVTNDTLVSTRHKIEFVEWGLENGKVDYNTEFDHTFQAYEDRDTAYVITLTTRFMTCEQTHKLLLYMPRVTEYRDTTVAYLCDADKASGVGYVWHGKRYTKYEFDSILVPATKGCDTILYLDLREPYRDTVKTLIFDYQTYKFHGQSYDQTGVYYYVSPNCDTAAVLDLFVYETLDAHLLDSAYILCAGDDKLSLNYEITKGSSRFYSNRFMHTEAIAPVVREALTNTTGAGTIVISIPTDVYPNSYSGILTLHDTLPESDVSMMYKLTVNYPVTVLTQRWNDVLAVKNNDYNGGYTFSAYQWYKNGKPIDGATESILYVPEGLDFTASYTAALTRKDDNITLFTCPVTPERVSGINDIPTLVPRNTPLQITGKGTARWFTALGMILSEQTYDDSPIMTPSTGGSFVLQLTATDMPVPRAYHIVVW